VDSLDSRALFAIYGGMHGAWAPLMIALTVIGAGWTALGLVPLVWAARTRAFGVALALAIAVQAVLVWSLKAAFGRVRPWLAFGLPPPIGHPHDGSFPSGHAAGSFCVAAFLAVVLPAVLPSARGRARLLSLLGLLLAASIALSRVYLGAHFPSDVIGGALLGGLVGGAGARLYLASG
jgi:undecaprenyl-diphosphatase